MAAQLGFYGLLLYVAPDIAHARGYTQRALNSLFDALIGGFGAKSPDGGATGRGGGKKLWVSNIHWTPSPNFVEFTLYLVSEGRRGTLKSAFQTLRSVQWVVAKNS